MKNINFRILLFFIILANDLSAQIVTYTFSGNGNWSDTVNWVNSKMPPASVNDSSLIIIDPISQGFCVLDLSQIMRPGSQLIVAAGKIFIIQGTLVNLIDNKAEVFINATDPRLAEVKTDSNTRITFFGERDVDGEPQRMIGYSIASISDSSKFDYVSLDDSGRYSNVFLRTGEKMNFDYSPSDSIVITLTGLDRTIQLIKINKKRITQRNNIVSNRPKSSQQGVLNAADRNIDIKVTKKNTLTGIEEDVTAKETVVSVLLNTYPYRIIAQYDNSTRFYIVKHSEVGINYNDPNLIKNTLNLIKSNLQTACNLGGLSQEFELSLDVFHTAICLSPTPFTLAVCAAWNTFTIGCKVSEAFSIIDHAIYLINESLAIPPISTIKASSSHYKLGTIISEEKTIDQIYFNEGTFDFNLTHLYTLPVLATRSPTFITSNSAISGGVVTDDGSSVVLKKGICWSPFQNPVIDNNPNKTINEPGLGPFTSVMGGLIDGITYHVRAYATNSEGTAYGNEVIFTTLTNFTTYAALSGTYRGTAIWNKDQQGNLNVPVNFSLSFVADQNGSLSGNMIITTVNQAMTGTTNGSSIFFQWISPPAVPFEYSGTFSADKKTIEGFGGAGNYYAPADINGPFRILKQ